MLAAAWAAAIRYLNHLPWWADILIGLALALLVLHVWIAIQKVRLLRGVKRLDITELGASCVRLHREITEWLIARAEGAPERRITERVGMSQAELSQESRRVWERGADYNNQTSVRLVEKFAARVMAECHLLISAGIRPPNLMNFQYNATGIAAYIGSVGELLQRGLLDEARKSDPEQFRGSTLRD